MSNARFAKMLDQIPDDGVGLNVGHYDALLVYGPLGQLRYIEVGEGRKGTTASVVYWDEAYKSPRLNPHLAGTIAPDGFPAWGLYEDLCRQTGKFEYFEKAYKFHKMQADRKKAGLPRKLTPKVPGPTSEKDPDGMKSGHRPVPKDWYHPVLQARRGGHDGNRPVESFDSILGIDTSGDVPKFITGAAPVLDDDLEDFAGVASENADV